MDLLTSNSKLEKSVQLGYLSAGIQMFPSIDICAWSSEGCRKSCLVSAGHGFRSNVVEARKKRTQLFIKQPEKFARLFEIEVTQLEKRAIKQLYKPAIRPNVMSDIPYYKMPWFVSMLLRHPYVQFYDYTANPDLAMSFLKGYLPDNYHITFSRKENNEKTARSLLRKGCNVAVVFKDELPAKYWNAPVIDGDLHDLTFLQAPGSIIGLSAKGKAKYDTSKFTV